MKLRIVIAAALAAIVVCVWLLTRDDTPPVSPEITSTPAGKSATSPDVATRKVDSAAPSETASKQQWENINWKAIGEIIGGKMDGRKMLTATQVEEFLRKRGETAINLLAAWEATGERRWLDRALELFPNNPALLLAALGEKPSNAADIIERLKRAAPDNPLAWVFGAQQLFKEKRTADALAELRDALKKPGFYTYASERTAAATQLYMDAGLEPLGAEYLALISHQLPQFAPASAVNRAMKTLAEYPDATPDMRREIAALTYGLGRMFATPEASRTLMGQIVGVAIERTSLTLAQAQEGNPLPVDLDARIAELDRQKEDIPKLTGLTEQMLAKQDAALLAEYLRKFRIEGEYNAMQWLRTRLR